jgi:hypothetical protein
MERWQQNDPGRVKQDRDLVAWSFWHRADR